MTDYIPDYTEQFNRYEAEREAAISHYPKCDYCGERILDEFLFDLEGDIVCEGCMKEHFRKHTEDYID